MVGMDPFYRETQICIKIFLKIFLGGDGFDDSSRRKLKFNGTILPRNLWFYRRKLKFTAPNLLPVEEFLLKFRSLTQSEAICRNSQAACLPPQSVS